MLEAVAGASGAYQVVVGNRHRAEPHMPHFTCKLTDTMLTHDDIAAASTQYKLANIAARGEALQLRYTQGRYSACFGKWIVFISDL